MLNYLNVLCGWEDIKVNVTKDYLTLSGETKSSSEKKGKNYYYQERAAGSFYRTVRLPVDVVAESAKAKYENGTLRIELKKKDYTEGREVKVE